MWIIRGDLVSTLEAAFNEQGPESRSRADRLRRELTFDQETGGNCLSVVIDELDKLL